MQHESSQFIIKEGWEVQRAFDKAILEGRMSHAQAVYGDYMYMYTRKDNGKDEFKHVETRDYLD